MSARKLDFPTNIRVTDCEFWVGTLMRLMEEDIQTLGELCRFSQQDLFNLGRFGPVRIQDCVSVLNQYGLCLRKEEPGVFP